VLRPGVTRDQVAQLVAERIVPAYRRLSDEVDLGLESIAEPPAVLAIQRWQSPTALARALEGPGYAAWWADYQPILQSWDELVEFDDEWETTELAV
jgi:hypothetical protein